MIVKAGSRLQLQTVAKALEAEPLMGLPLP